MKRAVTLFLIVAVILGGAFVSCKKKTTNEDVKKEIEANYENSKDIKKNLKKPKLKNQIDIKKLREVLKNRKNKAKKIEKKEEKPAENTEKKK
jgi:hypothetical protein